MKILSEIPHNFVALQGDTFQPEGDSIGLVASCCAQCGGIFFPKRRYCGRCGSERLDDMLLSREGIVIAFSTIDRKSAMSKIDPPYMQVCVAMPEGLNVYSVLAGDTAEAVTLGTRLTVCLVEVECDDQDRPVVAYAFRRVSAEETP